MLSVLTFETGGWLVLWNWFAYKVMTGSFVKFRKEILVDWDDTKKSN